MATTTVNPRSLGIEAHYLTTDVLELAALKAKLEDAGQPPPVASGIIGWLVDKAAGRRDATGSRTRSAYRKALADLGEHDPETPIILGTFLMSGRPGRRRIPRAHRRGPRLLDRVAA